ncbi:single-stranded DNA-binding protein [Cyanobacterium stanieri LEGE 03274]|uniref:Single-stranded DNA-binding protein n=1 Tax=Cyanobacterium stanieri LEGE 03274 TaxID=1828756 RepID=A0ABR9V7L0_9CHRO|nr:single-stranded DNA-binding protein [Cyanobacterium stanieri]MBE9223524.1 single-stranded DNA-binding protein [Cyanobacterium stanieri LEGE 03274]
MNSCVLTATIVRSPQLRYTQESQLAISEMMVEFESISPNNPPSTLKVIAWGNLATDIEQNYKEGDEVILSGRLKMDLVERQGYKEKIAELTVSQIQKVGSQSPRNNVPNFGNEDHYNDSGATLEEDHSMEDLQESDGGDDTTLDQIPF